MKSARFTSLSSTRFVSECKLSLFSCISWSLAFLLLLSCRFFVRSWEHFRTGPLLWAHAVSGNREVPQRERVQPVFERARRQLQCLHQWRAHQLLLWCIPWASTRCFGQVNECKKRAIGELLKSHLQCWSVLDAEEWRVHGLNLWKGEQGLDLQVSRCLSVWSYMSRRNRVAGI